MKARVAWAVAALCLLAHALLALSAARRIGVTNDEPVHLAAGFALLTRGEMRLNVEQPPLLKVIAALPLRGFHPSIDPMDADYDSGREFAYARRFMWDGHDADAHLARSRPVPLLLSLLLGLSIFIVGARLHGGAGGCLALAFYAFDPAFLGHGPIIQFDVGLALFAFTSTVVYESAIRAGSLLRYGAAGALLGLGLATKFTAVYVLPIWIALEIVERRSRARTRALGAAIAITMAASVLILCYGVVLWRDLGRGLSWQLDHASRGHRGYFLGQIGSKGSLLYFPIAFLLKTPIETQAALLLALYAAARYGCDRPTGSYVLSAGVFVALLLPSSIDIGHRYMLPAYPFLYAAVGILGRKGLAWSAAPGARIPPFRSLGAVLALILAVRALLVFPDYLGYCNLLAGREPERYLADSNLDWGQDLPRLRAWLRAHGDPPIRLAYTGMDSPERRGIRAEAAPCERTPGLYAVSINCYVGLLPAYDPSCVAWLAREPIRDRIGTSILIVDVAPAQ